MGQIQNAFNAGVGSIIAAKGIAEHLQGQAFDAVQSQYDEAKKIGKDAEEISGKIYENDMAKQAAEDIIKESNDKLEIKHPRDEKSGRFVNKKEYQRKLDMDIDKAVESLREVHKQQRAVAAQAQEFQARMDKYNARQGLVQKAINRVSAKKRPGQPDLNKIISPDQWNAIDLIKKTNEENK